MPIVKWFALYENSDLSQLSRNGKICKRAADIFDKLQTEFIDTFGPAEAFMEIRKKEIELEIMKITQGLTEDFSTQIFIDILQDEIDELKGKIVESVDYYESIMWLGIHAPSIKVDPNTLTVYDYHKYMTTVVKVAKKKQ